VTRYQHRHYGFSRPCELDGVTRRHRVAIVGAGPIGLTLAIDLALTGVASVVLDDNDVVSVGSRAICWAKRSLEIFDRLGVGERMVEKGVTWKVGRLFHGADEIWSFDLLPQEGHKMPAFINLQQYHVEEMLVERARDFPGLIELRFLNKVIGHADLGDHVLLEVETPEGSYTLEAEYLVACDGARSPTRERMGLELKGEEFEERFLIADVEMKAEFPSERWFWFHPSFHPGETALLHKQPDNIYRIDLQLGWDADPQEEAKPENVIPRIRKAVEGREFELDWVSVYSFRCARLDRFVHGRVIFCGDSAHLVSPFGARGGNGGIHDADNLAWKLAMVLKGVAPQTLLASYDEERSHGADENILHSARATRFMSPGNAAQRIFRDETLDLARDHAFARKLVHSGRLSTPCSLEGLSLQTPDSLGGARVKPGTVCPDARLPDGGFLLERLGGEFKLLCIGVDVPQGLGMEAVQADANGEVGERYGRGVYLVRPDQHVAAWFPAGGSEEVREALDRACARQLTAREKVA
jgi:3-(3-hydroxy-phenyl)propionate hydroxylase